MSSVSFAQAHAPAAGRSGPPAVEGGYYVVQVSDLRPTTPGPCPSCGRPSPRLAYRLPAGQWPMWSDVAGYTRYIDPEASKRPCSWCELLSAIHRLIPVPERPAIESPIESELRQLREWTHRGEPTQQPAYEGAFDPGRVYTTPNGLAALARTSGQEYDPGIPGMAQVVGGPRVPGFVARHVSRPITGSAARGAGQDPLAEESDRAADAVASGVGTIRSVFRLERTEVNGFGTESVAERVTLLVRSELDPRGSVTLVYVGDDGVDS